VSCRRRTGEHLGQREAPVSLTWNDPTQKASLHSEWGEAFAFQETGVGDGGRTDMRGCFGLPEPSRMTVCQQMPLFEIMSRGYWFPVHTARLKWRGWSASFKLTQRRATGSI